MTFLLSVLLEAKKVILLLIVYLAIQRRFAI